MSIKLLVSRGEEIVLAAVAALGTEGQAYGVSIYDKARELTDGRYISLGFTYTTLDRLEKDGYVESWYTEGLSPERGNRAKRCFRVTELGQRALVETARLSLVLRQSWGYA